MARKDGSAAKRASASTPADPSWARGASVCPSSEDSEEKRLLASVFQRASVGLCLAGPDNRVIVATGEWLKCVGLTAEQAVGKDVLHLFPEVRELVDGLREHRQADRVVEVSRRCQRTDGREKWWEGTAATVPVAGGVGILISVREVTAEVLAERERERRIREQAAREAAERERAQLEVTRAEVARAREEAEARTRELETVLEAVPDGVLVADRQGNVVDVNSAAVAIYGFSDHQDALRPVAEYQRIAQLRYPDGHPVPAKELAIVRALRGEKTRLREMRLRLRDGTERVAEISAAPVLDERGEVTLAVAAVRDVTERHRWQRHRELLARVSRALSQKLDLHSTLQTVMEQTLRELGAEAVAIFLAGHGSQRRRDGVTM